MNIFYVFFSLFTLASGCATNEMNESQVLNMVLNQYRMLVSNSHMKESLTTMNAAMQFISKMQNIQDSAVLRLNCMVANLHDQMNSVNKSLLSRRTKVEELRQLNEGLEYQIHEKDEKVKELTVSFSKLEIQLEDKYEEVEHLKQRNGMLEYHIKEKDKKVEELKKQTEELEYQIHEKDEKFMELTVSVAKLKVQLEDKNEQVKHLEQQNGIMKYQMKEKDKKIQDLEINLFKHQQQVQQLEQQVKQLNKTVELHKPVDWQGTCRKQQHLEKIKPLVEAFIASRNWDTLKKDMSNVLDKTSVEYGQLQHVTSLYYIGEYGYTQLATLLLCAGLPVEAAGRTRDNMLHGAARGDHLHVMKLLLDHGADINARGEHNNTPLIIAAYYNNVDSVKYLVQAGADTTAKDMYELTSLYWAKTRGNTAVQQLLEQYPH